MLGTVVPWPPPSLDNCAIGEDYGEIDNPIFHGPISDCICSTVCCQSQRPSHWRDQKSPAARSNHASNPSLPRSSVLFRNCHMRNPGRCWGSRRSAYRRAGVDWKEQTRVFDLVIETHPRHRGLNNNIHTAFLLAPHYVLLYADLHLLVLVQLNDLVHETEIDAHTAVWS